MTYGDVAQTQLVHNTLGYALFVAFYLVYTVLFLRGQTEKPNPQAPHRLAEQAVREVST